MRRIPRPPCGMLADVIELRTLSPDDWQVWRALRLAALAEAPYAFGSRLADWQGENDREDRWRERLSLPDSHNVAAQLEGEPVGIVTGLPADGEGGATTDVVELISMWVAPECRGHGVGNALIQEVARWAREVGAGTLRLNVAEGNRAANSLYERHGFRFTGEEIEPDADSADREYVMEARLLPAAHPLDVRFTP